MKTTLLDSHLVTVPTCPIERLGVTASFFIAGRSYRGPWVKGSKPITEVDRLAEAEDQSTDSTGVIWSF
jgi:hypothetical protein